ncbi:MULTISPECIES: hypothetical protein [Bacillaceae]|uniref:hypothetical protein n=1 Tax=Bacillaceae TaxID=186817 RepID=UPI000BA7088D|nr:MULTISPECIES: hypothetical protein [Bacillaceae]PAE22684.1 hypothetical protein CHI10_21925 [Bacillus sp. 7894-2]URM34627.1 hypothetical protein LLY41_09695 [Cytobacillus firmus]
MFKKVLASTILGASLFSFGCLSNAAAATPASPQPLSTANEEIGILATPSLTPSTQTINRGSYATFKLTSGSSKAPFNYKLYLGDGTSTSIMYSDNTSETFSGELLRYTRSGTFTASGRVVDSTGTAYVSNSVKVVVR